MRNREKHQIRIRIPPVQPLELLISPSSGPPYHMYHVPRGSQTFILLLFCPLL